MSSYIPHSRNERKAFLVIGAQPRQIRYCGKEAKEGWFSAPNGSRSEAPPLPSLPNCQPLSISLVLSIFRCLNSLPHLHLQPSPPRPCIRTKLPHRPAGRVISCPSLTRSLLRSQSMSVHAKINVVFTGVCLSTQTADSLLFF